LVLDVPPLSFAPDRQFAVSSMSVGYIREVVRLHGATLGLGAMGTLNMVPRALETAYGSRTPKGGVIFVRLRPFHAAAPMTGMPAIKMDDDHE
jgi:hypothetical protein